MTHKNIETVKRIDFDRPDELRDFPKPVIERPFPKWRRWGSETPHGCWLCWQLWKLRGIRPGISVKAG